MQIVNLNKVWAFARTEMKITSRLIRYWSFLVIAYLLGVGMYFYHSIIHAIGSPISATFGFLGPRYIVSSIGLYYLLVFISGMIFLAFDVRARDIREKVVEILDARPYSNLDLILGRFLGLLFLSWIPVAIFVCLLQSIGWFTSQIGFSIGGTIEPVSLFSFPLFIALPAMAFCGAIVLFISIIIRQQIIALALAAAVVTGLYYLSMGSASALSSTFDLMGFYQLSLPSDLDPSIAEYLDNWIQRGALIILGLGILIITAWVHPRPEGNKTRSYVLVSLFFLGLGGILLGKVYFSAAQQIEKRQAWRLSHESHRNEIFPDVAYINAKIELHPGKALVAALEIGFSAPADQQLKQAIFSLNPGFEIKQVSLAEDESTKETKTAFTFNDGLLIVDLAKPLVPGKQIKLSLSYTGIPDTSFGYLDSVIDPHNLKFDEAQVELLGVKNGIFSKNYIALMPGIYWLPGSGVDLGLDDTRVRPKDFFQVQIDVSLPKGWTPAGPGLRKELTKNDERVHYLFSPQASLPEVAVIAAPFQQYSVVIDDIAFELLMHPDHVKNLDSLRRSSPYLVKWMEEQLALIKDAGMQYPYSAMTLVEVPNSLRGYKGGWRLDTALTAPSIVMMKETGLPTAKFAASEIPEENSIQRTDAKTENDTKIDDEPGKVIAWQLIEYFKNDFTGGNIFTGAATSFFAYQTAATGSDAIALDYMLQQLTTLVLSGQQSYFSVAQVANFDKTLQAFFEADATQGSSISDRVLNTVNTDPQVWEGAFDAPLNNFDPHKNPRLTVDLLALKGGGMAKLIYDVLGPKKSGQLLAALIEKRRSQAYTRQDVFSIGNAIDERIGPLVEDWFTGIGLAGFTCENIEQFKLADDANGDNQYQLKLRIRNEEQTTGFTRISWMQGNKRTYSEPIRIPGRTLAEYAVVLTEPAEKVLIDPYVSLNRGGFVAKQFNQSNIASTDQAPVHGVNFFPWQPLSQDRIVIDDLDPGFSIITQNKKEDLRLAAENTRVLDQGLPVIGNKINDFPGQWSRLSEGTGWGKYRHTLAIIRPGDGNSKASFNASIPHSGLWKLELHLPEMWQVTNNKLGNWQLEIVANGRTEPVSYSTEKGLAGWNLVGQYQLKTGDVQVFFSDKTDRLGVIADAIAWSQVF